MKLSFPTGVSKERRLESWVATVSLSIQLTYRGLSWEEEGPGAMNKLSP